MLSCVENCLHFATNVLARIGLQDAQIPVPGLQPRCTRKLVLALVSLRQLVPFSTAPGMLLSMANDAA